MSTDEKQTAAPLDRMPAWQAVMAHHATIRDRHLRELFADDPGRAERLTAEGAGLFLDYSKHRVSDETMALLLAVARAAHVEERRADMFGGVRINRTEDRAVLHTALRTPADGHVVVEGHDVVRKSTRCWTGWAPSRSRCASASGRASPASRSAAWSTSASADPTWGPPWRPRPCATTPTRSMRFRFVSNVNETDIRDATLDLDPGGDPVRRQRQRPPPPSRR